VSWIRCIALGLISALYMLAGRWGLDRLGSGTSDPDPFLELRLWIVMGGLVLATLGLVHRAHRPARPDETRLDPLLVTAVLLFFGYLCLSALWAPDTGFALRKLYDLVLVAVMSVGFGLAALRQPAERVLNVFWGVVVAATGLLALTGVRLLLVGGASARLAVLGGGPNVFARLMGMLALGALYFWYRRGQAWLWISMAATGVLLALLTGSRGGSVAIIGGILTFLVVGRVPLRRLAVLALLATAAVGVATMITPLGKALNHAVEERFLKLTLNYDSGKSKQHSKVYLSGREHYYADALRLGVENPVSGAGLSAFPALGLGVYPHNLFLEVLSETGLVGIALLAWILVAFVLSALRGSGAIDGATVGAAMLTLIGSQSSGDLYDSRALYLLLVLASCTSAAGRRAVSSSQPRGGTVDSPAPASPPSIHPAVPGAA
jgi:O-antigen ligase